MRRSYILVATIFIILLIGLNLFAGTTGKISGKIIDAQTKEGLMGANVILVGTTWGAATDLDGNYFILNIPPGIYDLRATVIGYDTLTIRNVELLSDKTSTIDFKLSATVLKAKEVQVVAKRPAVEKDITSTTSYITSENIKQMPVQSVSEVLTTKTGVIAQGGSVHMRGGRGAEVSYLIDGMPVNDPVYGYQGLDVSTSSIQEVTAIIGTFNAEYGNAQSGVINIITKEGNPTRYSGSLQYRTDDFGFPDANKYSLDNDRMELTLSGPEPLTTALLPNLGIELPRSNRISFFGSYVQENSGGWINKVYDFQNHRFIRQTLTSPYLLNVDGWYGIFPERQNNDVDLTLKLKQRLSPSITYTLSWINSWFKYYYFDWDYYYTPISSTINKGSSRQLQFSLTHTLSPRTFYEFKVSNLLTERNVLPGGRTPADFKTAKYGTGEQLDDWVDLNGDGKPQVRNPYYDLNNNGKWDTDEPWVALGDTLGVIPDTTDTVGNPIYDIVWDSLPPQVGEEPWWDWNNNSVCDPKETDYPTGSLDAPEPYQDGEPFVDYGEEDSWVDSNGNGVPDLGEFIDGNHNGVMDIKNNLCDYHDANGNGRYDVGEVGETFTDTNNNGYYDAPDGEYTLGEQYYDINHNGKWDDSDGFYDRGFDRYAVWRYRSSNIWRARLDLTSQINNFNLIKTGLDFNWSRMIMKEIQYPEYRYDQLPDGNEYPEHGIFRRFYTRTPMNVAYYIQDKMEYGSLIANIGLRMDVSIQAPEVLEDSLKDEMLYLLQGWEDNIYSTRMKLSPRLGMSYPITDRSKLFFSYGHFYQLPAYDNFYQTATQASSAGRLLGNPNLDYEKTVSYELGVAYAPTEFLTLNVSGYYKDIYNLLNTSRHRISATSSIVQDVYKNLDYARSRGIELTLDKHYNNYWSTNISYQFAYAYGKSSSDRSGYDARFDQSAIPLRDLPLDWDRRHMLSVVFDLRVKQGDHPNLLGLTIPDGWGVNFLWQWGSGFPYTPDKDNPWVSELLGQKSWERINYLRLPNYSNIDMKANKDFTVKGVDLSLFLQINNLTNRRNILSINTLTGLVDDTEIEDGLGNGTDHDKDPSNWSVERSFEIGLEVSF